MHSAIIAHGEWEVWLGVGPTPVEPLSHVGPWGTGRLRAIFRRVGETDPENARNNARGPLDGPVPGGGVARGRS